HEYRLVYENLAERQRLLSNAPHLVRPLPFLIPLFGRDGVVKQTVAKAYATALWIYDLTGGWRIGKRHRRLSVDEAVAHLPVLRREHLVAGFLYYDAEADDARLTLTIARTAVVDHGAVAANYAEVVGLLRAGDRVVGARLADGTDVRAGCVVNAAGVWADEVRALDEGGHPDSLRPAKGVHITVPWEKVRCDIAAVIPVVQDRRSIFVVPWGDRVYLGTTDTDYDGPLDDPQCTADDVRYLLDAFNTFSSEPLAEGDVLGTWAGLRPLVKSAGSERTADLSRRHKVEVSPTGLVTIMGGKLTTYRKMAEDTVDEVVRLLGRGARRSPTAKLRLRGAEGADRVLAGATGRDGAVVAHLVGRDGAVVAHLVGRYGNEARAVLAMVDAEPSLGEPLVEGLPYLRAEAVYAARYEMARTLTDVLARRTRALLLDREAAAAAAADTAALVAPELGWSDEEAGAQVHAFADLVERERATI
ncbi:MAG: glycerol-3-phosphate dehydrogenase/oxidase, partial [Actinobacteria bacterium]|nr:glycerol-3-phosphate dehydrogenase/oxidase [Actinomycetota bacterium]